MTARIGATAALTLLLSCSPALAAPATVDLRVEGATQTLHDGALTTDGHDVTTAAGGTHKCDGTNGGANPSAGPTMTSALDDGARTAGFTFDGTYDTGYDDFFISTIGSDTNTGAPNFQPYWGLFVNYVASSAGGCQTRVHTGDKVQFLYSDFGQPLLELSGAPVKAETGQSFSVSVKQHDGNGASAPALGASVAGQTTAADGSATVSFSTPGVKTFKATRSGAVRSNGAQVCVYTPGSGDCDTVKPAPAAVPDNSAPVAHIGSLRAGAVYRRGPRVLSGTVSEDRALYQVYFRLRKIGAGGCRWFSGKRETFTSAGKCSSARFTRLGDDPAWSYLLPERLGEGRYILDVKALDSAFNPGRAQVRFSVSGG
jgi:hypothetical protein